MKVELKVLGMSCGHCVDKIEKFVGELDGIKSIDVDLKTEVVSIEAEESVSIDSIKEAILDSGFEVE